MLLYKEKQFILMNCKTVVKQVKLFTRMVHSDMRHFFVL